MSKPYLLHGKFSVITGPFRRKGFAYVLGSLLTPLLVVQLNLGCYIREEESDSDEEEEELELLTSSDSKISSISLVIKSLSFSESVSSPSCSADDYDTDS